MTLTEYLQSQSTTCSALAEQVRVRPQTVSRLVQGNRQPSGHLALRIERATGGAVTRHELRPDLYPVEDDTPAAS